jgi:(R,R)-butanediol dehydrogenase/meso-butanediol dehydrogenase/diacetyl reductase
MITVANQQGDTPVKAVRFHGMRDIRVEDVAAPHHSLKPHDVLIKPLACGICGTDLHEYVAGPIVTSTTPHIYTGATNPQILGHEFSAVVADVGAAVTHVKPGDRASIMPLITPRDDWFAKRGLYHLSDKMAAVGLSWAWGGMADYAVVNDYNVMPIPKTISDIQGAMIEPGAVALYGVDRGGVTAGSSVLVSGAGPIGALTLLAARAAGATKLFVSEPNPTRRKLAAELVPHAIVINPLESDLQAIIAAETDAGVGVDVAIECVGLEASLNACARAVRRGGKIVQVGLHMKPAAIDAMMWAQKDITFEGCWCFRVQMWPRIISMIEAGTYPVDKVVTTQIAAEDVVAKGFERLLDPKGQDLKILVRV